MFSSSMSIAKARVRPPTLYGPLCSQVALDKAVDLGKVFAKIISFCLILCGISPVFGLAKRMRSQTTLSAGLSEAK